VRCGIANRDGRKEDGERQRLDEAAMSGVRAPAGDGDHGRHDAEERAQQEQRIEPDQSDRHEAADAEAVPQVVLVAVGDDEAAHDEEQVDGDVAFRRRRDPVEEGRMEEQHHDRRDTAQRVERVEGPGAREHRRRVARDRLGTVARQRAVCDQRAHERAS